MSTKVMIIESDPWLSDHYGRAVEKEGYEVMCAANPYAAIDMIDDNPPSVIVMSLLLSGASGVGLLHELQTYADTAKIPVIVCSSLPKLRLVDLEPYGVKQLLNSTSMKPSDLGASVRSVLYSS